MLIDLQAPPYAGPGALWEDLKFDVRHCRNVKRVAVIGDRALKHAAVILFGALAPGEYRYIDRAEATQAWPRLKQ